ncbi:MAG TPA: type IV toxin-antitoxin system AbiEi family antitoxin domain-containing protein, partial [Streptosporangiaceae bacterium]
MHSAGMGNDIPDGIVELAQGQAGAVSRQQLLDAGLNPQLIVRRIERGRWQRLYRGVYATFTGPPPRETWLWAAVLRAGNGAVLSHQTAAELHGLIDAPAESIFVTVPSTRRITTPGKRAASLCPLRIQRWFAPREQEWPAALRR